MNKRLLNFLLVIVALSSCKKSASEPEGRLSLLTGRPWKRALKDMSPDLNPKGTILYDPLLDCMLDDGYSFSATSNKLTITKGLEQCNGTVGDTEIKDFSMNALGEQIIIDGEVFYVAELSSTQMKLYVSIPYPPNNYAYYLFLYQH